VQHQHEKAAEAVMENKVVKKEIRDQINKELTEAARRLKEEQLAEMAKKEELIR
jgi:hypothetical protein